MGVRKTKETSSFAGARPDYHDLYENSPDMLVSADGDTELIQHCNHTLARELGYSDEELAGQPVYLLFSAESADYARTELFPLFRETGRIIGADMTVKRKDGSLFPVSLNANAVRDKNGKIVSNRFSLRDITRHKDLVEQLRDTLAERDVQIKEIHHRVKNNLQIISSLLSLQSRRIENKETIGILKTSQTRIHSISLVHKLLYRSSDLARIDMAHYIKSLATHLYSFLKISSDQIALEVDANSVDIDIAHAVSCGLIINEAMTNSFKYGFPGNKRGKIHVAFAARGQDDFILTVGDNGIGIEEDIDIYKAETLGLLLITSLTEQLCGKLELTRKNGTLFKITFPQTSEAI